MGRKKQEKLKVGRPSKLTQEVSDAFFQSLKAGNYLETAAAFAGIAKPTVYEWLRKGARDEGREFVEFLNAVKKAQAANETQAIATVTAASKQHWQAAAWKLERMFPKRWGQRIRVNVEEELNAFLTKLEQRLPPDIYERVLAAGADEPGEGEAEEAPGEEAGDGEAPPVDGVDS